MVPHNPNSWRPTVSLAAAMAISGTVGVFAIHAQQPTLNIIFFRCLFGALSLAVWCLCVGKLGNLWRIERSHFKLVILSGLFLVLNWAFLFQAFKLISIGLSLIIYNLQPFWIVLIGAAFLGEPLSRDRLLWLGFGFAGLVLVVWPRVGDIMSGGMAAAGVGCALLASLLYAGSTLTARKLKAVDPAVLAIVHCIFGLLLFAPFLSLSALDGAASSVWLWLSAIGIVHTGIVYVMIYSSYPKLPTANIGVCAFFNPITALICDFVFYGKVIGLFQIIGVLAILLAGLGITLGGGRGLRLKEPKAADSAT